MPRRNLMQSKSEEIFRGIAWAVVPSWVAWMTRHREPLSLPAHTRINIEPFFHGIISESFYGNAPGQFYDAGSAFLLINVSLLVRIYCFVAFVAVVTNILIWKYGAINQWLGRKKYLSWMKKGLASFVLPRVSEWHVILSTLLLSSNDLRVELDVMTKDGKLYRGAYFEKALKPDGSLLSLRLSSPERFRRDEFLAARGEVPDVSPTGYWTKIPGNIFVIMADEIVTLNIRHVATSITEYAQNYKDSDLATALKTLSQALKVVPESSTDPRDLS